MKIIKIEYCLPKAKQKCFSNWLCISEIKYFVKLHQFQFFNLFFLLFSGFWILNTISFVCFKNCSFKKLVTTVSCSNSQRDDHHVSFEPTVMKFGQKKVSKKLFFLNCVSFLQISCHFYHSKLQIIKLDNFFPSALIFKKQTQFSQKRFSHGFCYPNFIKVGSTKPPW